MIHSEDLMDDKTRLRVVLASFVLLTLVGSLDLISTGVPALALFAGVAFWAIACAVTGFVVNRALYGVESRKLHH